MIKQGDVVRTKLPDGSIYEFRSGFGNDDYSRVDGGCWSITPKPKPLSIDEVNNDKKN